MLVRMGLIKIEEGSNGYPPSPPPKGGQLFFCFLFMAFLLMVIQVLYFAALCPLCAGIACERRGLREEYTVWVKTKVNNKSNRIEEQVHNYPLTHKL